MAEVRIGSRMVGDGHPCFITAEIGSNHNQDYDTARRLIDAAAAAGVDAVKFQTFRAAEHYSRRTPGFSYLDNTDTFALIESLELDRTWQAGLLDHARGCGVEFFSSPCDAAAIDDLEALGVPTHKVASFDITDTALIAHVARSGKPVVLSTGLADLREIQLAVDAVGDPDRVILLQCTSLYPAPPHLANLRAMQTLRTAFGCLVGYSDHTIGDTTAIAAVALGACFLEKHFTLSRDQPGPDHPFAMEPTEFTAMVRAIRDVESALGDGRKAGPRPAELEMAQKGKRSLHAAADIPAGSEITEDMLVVKRPGLGIAPALRSHVVGRRAARLIEADEWILWDALA